MDVRDGRAAARRCTIALLDERAERVPVRFISQLADGSSYAHYGYLGDAGAGVAAVSDPALPPGRYTLVAGPEGKEQHPFPIVIEAGVVTPLVVTLDE